MKANFCSALVMEPRKKSSRIPLNGASHGANEAWYIYGRHFNVHWSRPTLPLATWLIIYSKSPHAHRVDAPPRLFLHVTWFRPERLLCLTYTLVCTAHAYTTVSEFPILISSCESNPLPIQSHCSCYCYVAFCCWSSQYVRGALILGSV